MHDDVVGRVQALAIEGIHQHSDAAIVLGARDAARAVFAGYQPSLAVARVAVAVVRRRAEGRDQPGFLAPAHHAVVRDVGKQEVAAIAKPHWPFRPARPRPQALDHGAADAIRVEARVERFDGRVGVAHNAAILAPGQRSGAFLCHSYAPSFARVMLYRTTAAPRRCSANLGYNTRT